MEYNSLVQNTRISKLPDSKVATMEQRQRTNGFVLNQPSCIKFLTGVTIVYRNRAISGMMSKIYRPKNVEFGGNCRPLNAWNRCSSTIVFIGASVDRCLCIIPTWGAYLVANASFRFGAWITSIDPWRRFLVQAWFHSIHQLKMRESTSLLDSRLFSRYIE